MDTENPEPTDPLRLWHCSKI